MSSRLQEEIKQSKPFATVGDEALLSILRTSAGLEHAIGEALKPHGVTNTQYNVLRILRGARPDGLCGREIGERLVARVPDVPRLLDRMEELGLLTRERDQSDRRHVTARITKAGMRILEVSQDDLENFQRKLLARLTDTQLEHLVDALATIRENG